MYVAWQDLRNGNWDIYLASSAEVQGLTGKYFTKCKEVPSSPASMDRDSMRRLWELSCSMTGLPAAD